MNKEGARSYEQHEEEQPGEDGSGARGIGLRGDGGVEWRADIGDGCCAAGFVEVGLWITFRREDYVSLKCEGGVWGEDEGALGGEREGCAVLVVSES